MTRKVAEEGGGFSTKAPSYLDPDDDEPRTPRARELGVRLAPLSASGGLYCCAWAGVGARLRHASPCDRTDDSGINSELRSVPEG